MKITQTLVIAALGAIALQSASAQLVTSFGANAENGGSWVYTSSNSTLTGIESAGDLIYGTPSFSNYTGGTQIEITANAITAPTAGFSFVMEDNTGKLATALFAWTWFIGGSTQVSNLNFDPGFSSSNVVGWSLFSGGSGSSIDVALSSATVVPEPGSMALIMVSATALILFRRRRKI